MITLANGKMCWQRHDVLRMSRILGAEQAEQRWAPCNPSILKLAKRYHVPLSQSCARVLRQHTRLVRLARRLGKGRDAAPTGQLGRKAWPLQRAALAFFQDMEQPSYLLADDVGIGKSLSAMLFAEHIKAERVLVVCMNMAKDQWVSELKRWTGIKATMVEGTVPEQIALAKRKGWVVGHWESLVHAAEGYMAQPWDLIIADEVQQAQNRKAQRTETLIDLKATRRLAMSAHPYNRIDQLYAILRFLYKHRYTSYWRFFNQHVDAEPQPFGGYEILGARRKKLLKWEIAPFTLRRTRKQANPNLPLITRVPRMVELTATARREYEKLRRQFFVEIDAVGGGTKTLPIINALARTTRMRQYLIDPAIIGGRTQSIKFPAVHSLLEEIGKPTVIFTMFAEAAKNLAQYLRKKKQRVDVLSGAVNQRLRPAIQKKFLAGKLDALIIVTQLGGTSLNLGRYGYGIGLDLPWTMRDMEQTEGRFDRPDATTGQRIPSTMFYVLVKDSYEDRRMIQKVRTGQIQFKEVFTVNDLKEVFA